MNTQAVLVVVLALVLVLAAFQTIEIGNIKSKITGNSVAQASGAIDKTGWTANEIMNYEMHGTIPARAGGGSSSGGSGMVGGC